MSKVVEIALKEVGYSEYPENTNKTKFGKWFGLDGVAWCGIFVSYCFSKAGIVLPKIGFSTPGFAGCQTAYAYFKKNNMITTTPKVGDIVLFDWNADGRYDHTGIFIKDLGKGQFQSVEGNTSEGNDSNGGSVMVRERSYKSAIFIKII